MGKINFKNSKSYQDGALSLQLNAWKEITNFWHRQRMKENYGFSLLDGSCLKMPG